MASVDRDTLNGVGRTTDVHAGGQPQTAPFNGQFVFGADAFPAFALASAMKAAATPTARAAPSKV